MFRDVFTRIDPTAQPVLSNKIKNKYEPDPALRDFENVPLKTNITEFFENEVLNYVPDAWIDHTKDKIGYEINFNRYFYQYRSPCELVEIDADLKNAEQQILQLLREVTD